MNNPVRSLPPPGAAAQRGAMTSSFLMFSRSHTTTHHSRQDSSGRVISSSQRPLPENTQHSRQTSMPPVGFEPTISAGERSQIYALDRSATGTGFQYTSPPKILCIEFNVIRTRPDILAGNTLNKLNRVDSGLLYSNLNDSLGRCKKDRPVFQEKS